MTDDKSISVAVNVNNCDPVSTLLNLFRSMHESEQVKFFENMPEDKRSLLVAAITDDDIAYLAYDLRNSTATLLNLFHTLPVREQEKFFDCNESRGSMYAN